MRFKNPSAAGKESQRIQRERRMNSDAPESFQVPSGQVLHTLRWTDHLTGVSTEIRLVQATRRNQIIAQTFGRSSQPHGTDWLMRHLRSRLVTRWAST